jgi:hypothetical protein
VTLWLLLGLVALFWVVFAFVAVFLLYAIGGRQLRRRRREVFEIERLVPRR